ncbi:MAG: hypothetical protein RL302_2023 [Pseudomonadota bacterium]|jgi:hypothetical protein
MNFDRPYFTGPMALTDVHAEGGFFGLVYRECLRFEAGGRVRWWREVVDASLPGWDNLDEFCRHTMIGTFARNDRGHLFCKFPSMELTGVQCEEATHLMVFHAWFPLSQERDGRVFHAPEAVQITATARPASVLRSHPPEQ